MAAIALAMCASACGGGGASPPSSGTGANPKGVTPAAGSGLSLSRQVGQSLVLSFEGTTVPPYVTRALREGRVAGVILFAGNVASPGQLRTLTAQLRRESGGSALVMVDQEGGPVRIVPFAAPATGQGAQSTSQEAGVQAAAAARDLRSLGINVNLAPVADVPSVAGAALAGRAFSGDAHTVAARVGAAVEAYRAGRVGATAKHFPGLGGSQVNTDDAPVTISTWGSSELEPFRAAVRAGAPLVMASHALYPALDREHIASQSPAILRDLLRGRLGFSGVVVTDSMEAAAVLERSSIGEAAVRALDGGADLLLLTGNGSFRPVFQRLESLARRSPAFRARLAQSSGRVLALKRRLGLAEPPRPGRR